MKQIIVIGPCQSRVIFLFQRIVLTVELLLVAGCFLPLERCLRGLLGRYIPAVSEHQPDIRASTGLNPCGNYSGGE